MTPDRQVDHVGEVVEVAISRRPVLDDLDHPIQALTDGIGQGSVDEGQDVHEVRPQGADKGPLVDKPLRPSTSVARMGRAS